MPGRGRDRHRSGRNSHERFMALSPWRAMMFAMKSAAARHARGVVGLGKDEIRQIVLEKLRVVYNDWGSMVGPSKIS